MKLKDRFYGHIVKGAENQISFNCFIHPVMRFTTLPKDQLLILSKKPQYNVFHLMVELFGYSLLIMIKTTKTGKMLA